MLILALECSTSKGSVALLKSEKLISEKIWEHQRSTSANGELVVPRVHEILSEEKIKIENIDLFAVDIGPGRFTGVRVGINTVKSFSFVTGKPILSFTSLEILVQNANPKTHLPVLTLINAHKNLAYVSSWNCQNGLFTQGLGPAVYKISELEEVISEPHLCLGDGFEALESNMSERLKGNLVRVTAADDFPSAEKLGRLAFREAKKRPLSDWKSLFPLYIRASEAEEKLKSGELKPVTQTNLKR